MSGLMFWLDNRLTVAQHYTVRYDNGGHALFTTVVDGVTIELQSTHVTLLP